MHKRVDPLKPKKRLPLLKLRKVLRRSKPRLSSQRRRRNSPRPRRLPLMPPLKLMRDFHQNLPQLSDKEANGTSEFE